MAIRMSGMISGLDTESIVKSLMETQQAKKTKIESKKQKLETGDLVRSEYENV